MAKAGEYVIFKDVTKIVGFAEHRLSNKTPYEVHSTSAYGIDVICHDGPWHVTELEQERSGMEVVTPKAFKEIETRTVTGILKDAKAEGDSRYQKPKKDPIAEDSVIDKVIQENPIYRELHQRLMLGSQRKQVAYGFDKYVETLNVNSWNTVETLDHIIDEGVDKLHYLIMLKMKIILELESKGKEEL